MGELDLTLIKGNRTEQPIGVGLFDGSNLPNGSAILTSRPSSYRLAIGALRQHRKLVTKTLLGSLIIGALFALLSTPYYRSEAILEIANQGSAESNQAAKASYLKLILSDRIADRVLAETSLRQRLKDYLSGDPIRAYANLVEAQSSSNSDLINFAVTTRDPALSAMIANAHLTHFYRLQDELRTGRAVKKQYEVELASQTIIDRVTDERRSLLKREDEVARSNLVLVEERITLLNQQLVQAREKRMLLQAKLEETLADPNTVRNDQVQQLTSERAAELSVKSELANEYGPRHPRMKEIDTSVAKLSGRLLAEREGAVTQIRSEFESAKSAEEGISVALERELERSRALSEESVASALTHRKLQALETALDSVQAALPLALVGSTDTLQTIEPPSVPHEPVGPIPAVIIGLFGALGLITGVIVAMFKEFNRRTLRNSDDVAHRLGVATLALIPEFPQSRSVREEERIISRKALPAPNSGSAILELSEDLVISDLTPAKLPCGLVAAIEKQRIRQSDNGPSTREAFRLASSTLLMEGLGEQNIVAITSSRKGEGKTTTLCNIAVALAECGKEVVIVDGDLRSPAVHQLLGVSGKEPGLLHYLAGELEIAQVVSATQVHKVSVVTAGGMVENPTEYLADAKFDQLLDKLAEMFDFVLIDSPPITPIKDALFIAKRANQVAYLINSQATSYDTASQGIKLLRQVGISNPQVILNHLSRDAEVFETLREFTQY